MEPLNVSIVEAARILGVGRSKAYELLAAGKLEGVKLGARTLVRVASIKAFSDSLDRVS
ncbi:MAG: helix-turn-helix domain-containing protein [Polymorphobacter sp.]|uniref:helix-turn-helix domain-containing protein n=1 Tax=Polymorphobacter sp. TaxID=1909290 RepID=UPI003A87D086